MKDKELRQSLRWVGILDSDETYSEKAQSIIKYGKSDGRITELERQLKQSTDEIKTLGRKLDAVMELLNITENKEPAKHELIKGKKSASISKKKEHNGPGLHFLKAADAFYNSYALEV